MEIVTFPISLERKFHSLNNLRKSPIDNHSHWSTDQQLYRMSSDPCTYCPPPKPSVKSWQTHTRAPETFTRFPKLAPEIRIKIWRLAASETREIKLYVLSPEWMDTKMKEQTRAPAIMHTCRESRCVECENRVPLSNSLIISVINFSYSYTILLLEYC
jgi:hypothetical protein